jgi:hypothetical protein
MRRYVNRQPEVIGLTYAVTTCLLLILLSGCGAAREVDAPLVTQPTSTLPVSIEKVEGVTPEPWPTPTLLASSTTTLNTTETATNMAELANNACQFEIEAEVGDFQLGHPLVYLAENRKGLLKSDLSGHFQPWLSPVRHATFNAISPDGNWLVYRRDDELIVLAIDNGREIVYPWQEEWAELWGWVSLEKVAIRHEVVLDTDLFVIFSPFLDPPHVETLELPWQFIPEFNNPVNFNPGFTLVLYPKGLSIAVADIYTAADIWEKPLEQSALAMLGVGATWSPDGEFIALGLPAQEVTNKPANELAILSKDGNVLFQTNYHKTYVTFTIMSPRWSPNGRYLSFWLIIPGAENHPLQIYDTFSGEFLDICVLHESPIGARWSLDSQQIAYITNLNHLVVYDLPSQRAVLLADDVLRLTGWINREE